MSNITTWGDTKSIVEVTKVDAPASDELTRAEELADLLAKRLLSAERFNRKTVDLPIEQARELCQLLHDSIRTAKQIARR